MLATNSVQLAGWMSALPPDGQATASTVSAPGETGLSDPGGLAISGLAVIEGWPPRAAGAGTAPPAAGAANGVVDEVSW